MAKSMIVTLPCVFLLLDAWPLGRWRKALWPPGRNPEPDFGSGLAAGGKASWFVLVLSTAG